MNENYPAAHSMDTDWFAVDEDGHVALFDSGEPGAVPKSIASPDHGYDALKLICEEAFPFLLREKIVRLGVHPGSESGGWGCRYVVASRKDALDGVKFDDGRPLALPPVLIDGVEVFPFAVGWWKKDEYEKWHRRGLCLACFGDRVADIHAFGIFGFECDYDDVVSDTPIYKRTAIPQRTLRLSDLPPAVREKLVALKLPGAHFSQQAELQPIEHVESNTWGAATYLGTDGQVHPVPGYVPPPDPPIQAPVSRRRWWQFWK